MMKQNMTVFGIVFACASGALGLPVTAAGADPSGGGNMHNAAQERFALADKNADGQLTAEEVEGKMPYVSSHFAQIDVDKNGKVTKDELRQHAAGKRPASSGAVQ